ncbi:hypothetical protein TAMYLO_600004 [Tenacibaculum amylolyticum]
MLNRLIGLGFKKKIEMNNIGTILEMKANKKE